MPAACVRGFRSVFRQLDARPAVVRVLSGGSAGAEVAGGAPPAGDSGFAEWALKRLTPPPMWQRPFLDFTFAHPYIPALGFAVSVDAAARLGRALPAIALTSVFPPGSFYQDHPVSDDVKVPRSPHPRMSRDLHRLVGVTAHVCVCAAFHHHTWDPLGHATWVVVNAWVACIIKERLYASRAMPPSIGRHIQRCRTLCVLQHCASRWPSCEQDTSVLCDVRPTDCPGGEETTVQATMMFDLESPLLAPRWLDGPQPLRGYEAAPFLAAIIDVRYLVPATGSSTPAGFAVLPVLRRPPRVAPNASRAAPLFVAAGAFQLPLFKGVPSMALLAEMKRSGDVQETLARALRVRCVLRACYQDRAACWGMCYNTVTPAPLTCGPCGVSHGLLRAQDTNC